MSIPARIQEMKDQLPKSVELIAISKTKPESDIIEAYEMGQRHFGENKVQDLVAKHENLAKDIHWHFIGHLQTNKVRYIAPFVHLVHAVDSIKVLKTLQKEALKNERIINCLLQAKIAQEDSKFGMTFDEIEEILEQCNDYPNLCIKGLMGMATNTTDQEAVKKEFTQIKNFFDSIKNDVINTLSIGMSNDWPLAIDSGSTMIRVGSSIFGVRNY